MSKKAFELFFAAGADDRRSSLWRAWGSKKGDVYVTSAEIDSDFKLSLHPSGRCHLSFQNEQSINAAKSGVHPFVVTEDLPKVFAGAKSDGHGRFDDIWTPSEIAPDLVMPFRLCLPESELRPLRREVLGRRDVRWLPTPGVGRALEVAFMIAGEAVPSETVPGSDSVGNQLLMRHEFGIGRSLLVLWREYVLSQEEQMWVTAYRLSVMPPSDAVRESFATHDYHRVMVVTRDDAYSSRAVIDTAIE